MVRAFTFVLLFLEVCICAHATLVVMVPSRDGLVIAADSRLTFMGRSCDGGFKILAPARLARTVVIVTGDGIFVAPPPAGESDPCRYLATAPRQFDIGSVVMQTLERGSGNAAQISMPEVAAACLEALERFRSEHPAALRPYGGREIFSVVVASYDPVKASSKLRNFVVRLGARTNRAEAVRMTETNVLAESARGVWIFGETEYVNRNVYGGYGRRFLEPSTLDFLEVRTPVSETPLERAEAAAANVIGAASRAAEVVTPPSGIGGPMRLMVVGRDPRPHLQPWRSR